MYLALCRPNSLTTTGKSNQGSILRKIYKNNYVNWHKINKNLYVEFPLKTRTFPIPIDIL